MKKLLSLILAALLALTIVPTALAEDATELTYTPGKDLLLGEAEGLKVWLVGKKPKNFGVYDEFDNGYPLYYFRIDNDRDEYVIPKIDMTSSSLGWCGAVWHLFDAHSSEEDQLYFEVLSPNAETDEAVRTLESLTFGIKLYGSDYDSFADDADEVAPIADFGTVVVHFGSAIEAIADADAADAALEPFLGTWETCVFLFFDENGAYQGSVPSEAVMPEKGKLVIEPEGFSMYDDVGDSAPSLQGSYEIGTFKDSGENVLVLLVEPDELPFFIIDADSLGEGIPEEPLLSTGRKDSTTLGFRRVDDAQTAGGGEAAQASDEASGDAVEAQGPGEVHTDKETVKAAQQALNDAGYSCGTPDGIAGKKTAAAVSQYQEDNGLEVTGEIDDALLAALGLAAEAPEDAAEDAAASQADEDETDAVADTGTDEAEADAVADTGTDEADDDAAADTGEGDIPQAPVAANDKIPQELVRATGGLPERIDDLENRYSIGGIKALYANWETEGPAALTSLVESGSCEVNTFGYDFMPSTIVTLPSKTSIDIHWSLSWSNVLSISLQQPLPEDNIDEAGNEIEGYCMTLLRFDEAGTLPTIVVEAYKYLNDPSREIETALTVWYSVGDVGDYTSVVCGISMGAGQSDSVSLEASLDNTRYLWTGYYDPSGSLIDTEVETVALS